MQTQQECFEDKDNYVGGSCVERPLNKLTALLLEYTGRF